MLAKKSNTFAIDVLISQPIGKRFVIHQKWCMADQRSFWLTMYLSLVIKLKLNESSVKALDPCQVNMIYATRTYLKITH